MVPFPAAYYTIVSESPNSVLLETSRPDCENKYSYLFVNPLRILTVETLDAVPALFGRIEECLRRGWYVAGFLSYECGYGLEPCVGKDRAWRSPLPLAWFGVYEEPFVFSHASGFFETGRVPHAHNQPRHDVPAAGCNATGLRLDMSREEYCDRIDRIRDYIAAGDTYQVNFTSKLRFEVSGSGAELFAQLRDRQRVPYAAFLHVDQWNMLSFSPELFFRIDHGRILTRPMKGTAPRGRTLGEDERIRNWLQGDPKNRSENVMIVDLLRNDLGRICEIGSIRVDDLFATEKYETLFQMTSAVSGTLRPKTPLLEIFRAMFPCGSVTGAPKFRTMQIIRELEAGPRGVYTGAIGYFAPNGNAVFNVAIRTLVLTGHLGEMGVGSGIVFDSASAQEYEECLLKAQFLARPVPKFELLETILWDGRYELLPEHIERLKSSAEYFGFAFQESEIISALERCSSRFEPDSAHRVRLLLQADGTIRTESTVLHPSSGTRTVVLTPHRVSSRDRFLYHKTTHRELYETLYADAIRQGHEDVIFANERGEITEGTRNNIFIQLGNALVTPPVDCGLLPGVFRRHVLETEPHAVERVVSVSDLQSAEAIYLCNSVRGMRRVSLAAWTACEERAVHS